MHGARPHDSADTQSLIRIALRRPEDSLGQRIALLATCQRVGAAIEPAHLGRFTVARNLGRGGQGCVYEGFDPQLQRRVALKIPRFAHGADLEFEARALAAVRHPNLVTVYALEICEGRPVVVMELVEGTPLLGWIAAARPSPRRIVDTLAEIGDGLVELHACGLTHRDVKPGNVLVDDRGRARLVDLGLAAFRGDTDGALGTPAFAAPEQLRGAPADPAADQFGLAATLQAALVARGGRVPARARSAIERAMADDPARRFADMAAFVTALRGGGIEGPAIAGAGVLAIGLAMMLGASEDPCARDPAALQQSWAARDDLRAHFDAMSDTIGRESFAVTERALDDWTDRFSAAATSVCASPAGAEWTGPRAQCLDDAAHAFDDVVDVLGSLDVHAASVAPELAVALPGPERCTDTAIEELPAVIDHADTIDVRRRLSAISLRCRYGLTADCSADYEALAADATAREVDPCTWEPLLLLLRGQSGQYSGSARETLQRAVWSADACRLDGVRFDATRVLAELAAREGDADEAELLLRNADATLDAMRRPVSEEVALEASRATTMIALGRPHDAAPAAERALALHESLHPANEQERAQLQDLLANALSELGELDRAEALQNEALRTRRATLGDDHPTIAHALANLAVLHMQHDAEKARAYNREALAIFEKHARGHEMPLAIVLAHQADFELEAGDLERARIAVARSLVLFEAMHAEEDAFAADALLVRARLHRAEGDLQAALATAKRANAILEGTRGPTDASTLDASIVLAEIHDAVGEPERAHALRCRAHETWSTTYGSDHPLADRFLRRDCT
jgi:tetratricopeptide (TPR) repeat protein